ncbi:MAG: F-box/WD40 repeat-containing protein [Kistimonas sp.]|nr:F-box/WD40 repeat-containing protein [Kistimonas sp.]
MIPSDTSGSTRTPHSLAAQKNPDHKQRVLVCGPGHPRPGPLSGNEALRCLSRLPLELQHAVFRHLPLDDILVWQRVSRHFCDWIRKACLRERALRLSFGHAFAQAAFTQQNHDELLQPWLAAFSTHVSQQSQTGVPFRAEVLFWTLNRTLQNTRHMVLEKRNSFRFPGAMVLRGSFSPDGRYFAVEVLGSLHRLFLRTYILEQDRDGWHEGSPFVSAAGADHVRFTADARRVAVADSTTAVSVWDKHNSHWVRQACLGHQKDVGSVLAMDFSPSGSSLIIEDSDKGLDVWCEDPQRGWLLCGFFPVAEYSIQSSRKRDRLVFSADEHWLLLHAVKRDQFVLYSKDSTGHWTLPSPLETGPGRTAKHALFRYEGQQLQPFLLVSDGSLSQFGFKEGRWFEQAVIRHTNAIVDARFSPDRQDLITQCPPAGTFLWRKDARGEWTQQHILYRGAPNLCEISVRHDLASRWLLAGDSFSSDPWCASWYRNEAPVLWVKDHTSQWKCRPDGVDDTQIPCRYLTHETDGSHLASLGICKKTSREVLRLLELRKGKWLTKAEQILSSRSLYKGIVMDPFCCYIPALISSAYGVGVDMFRVQEAPSTQCHKTVPGASP